MRQLTILVSTTTDVGSLSGEEQPTIRKLAIKSSKVRTADSIISKCVTWLHEVVYSAVGKPAVYDVISMGLFVHRYLIVMEEQNEALKAKWLHI